MGLTMADKMEYEQQLNNMYRTDSGKKVELVPVWTLEDADGQSMGNISESPETQGRFRKYAEQGMSSKIAELKSVLWPLLHYVLWTETDGRQEKIWWDDYVKLNQKFAQKIIEIYQPGDISILFQKIQSDHSLGTRLLSGSSPRNDQKQDPKCSCRNVYARPIPIIRIFPLSTKYRPLLNPSNYRTQRSIDGHARRQHDRIPKLFLLPSLRQHLYSCSRLRIYQKRSRRQRSQSRYRSLPHRHRRQPR